MRKMKSQKGITLIALIITIIVLLILAVVTIGVVQEDGIIGKAKYARDEYEKAQAKENSILQGYLDKLNENAGNKNENTGNGNGGSENIENGNTGDESTGNESIGDEETGDETSGDRVVIIPDTTIEEAQDDDMLTKATNSNVIDKYENPIIVPAGFKILIDDTTGYTVETIDVTKGIVIEDASGNQFVWVPVGNVYYSETEYKTITLGRYENFYANNEGEYIPVQIAANYATAISIAHYEEYTSTNHNSDYENAIAKDIGAFVESATTKGGYYLARYEAGVENGNLDTSEMVDSWTAPNKNWTGYVDEDGKELELVSKKDVQVWNYVTQNKASELARGMYTSGNFTSDLVNSYAWDTAIIFIQTFSNDSNYSYSNYTTSFANTGINKDKYCNIHDMSGNAQEWTTETSSLADNPCVSRGGYYNINMESKELYTFWRHEYSSNTNCYDISSFRSLLYVAL